jgi:hypothetical protein
MVATNSWPNPDTYMTLTAPVAELATFVYGICEAEGTIRAGQVGVRGCKDESK